MHREEIWLQEQKCMDRSYVGKSFLHSSRMNRAIYQGCMVSINEAIRSTRVAFPGCKVVASMDKKSLEVGRDKLLEI